MGNMSLGLLDSRIGSAIFQAAAEIADGNLADQFPLHAMQGGAGTSTHMNVNEVIAPGPSNCGAAARASIRWCIRWTM